MKAVNKLVLAASVCAWVASMAQANVVSWNMNVFGDSPTGNTGAAGVVSSSYWNDTWLDGLSNPANDLRDNTGAATTLDVSWASFNTYRIQGSHPGTDTDGSYNKEILNGYLNSGTGNTPLDSTVTLAQIPYASYDVYVYFSSDTAGRTGSVTDGSTTNYFNTLGSASLNDASGNALLVQATDTTTAGYAVAANYAKFSGLSGATQTLSSDIPSYGGIAAIQIVQIPEPATLGLVGVFGAGVLFVRRRFMI